MSALLLDTGPVVASLDRSDSHHAWTLRRFVSIQGHVLTTGAVITEAACFLQDVRDGIPRLFDLIESLRVQVWDCFSTEKLRAAETLMCRNPSNFGENGASEKSCAIPSAPSIVRRNSWKTIGKSRR